MGAPVAINTAVTATIDGGTNKGGATLYEVICDRNAYDFDWLVNWMAYGVQHPDLPAEAAVVLRGLKAVGKGMVARIMRRFFPYITGHRDQPGAASKTAGYCWRIRHQTCTSPWASSPAPS